MAPVRIIRKIDSDDDAAKESTAKQATPAQKAKKAA
jgi:hypothetical protein